MQALPNYYIFHSFDDEWQQGTIVQGLPKDGKVRLALDKCYFKSHI